MQTAQPNFDNTPRSGVEIAKNTYAKIKEREEKKILEQLHLPLWPDDQRAVPNGILRSALFGAIRPGQRRYIDGEQIRSLAGIELKYTGQKLDQGDLDVWEALLHIARVMNLGNICFVSTYEILNLLDLADTGSNRKILYKCLTRLRATAIELKQGRYYYLGGLVDEAQRDDLTGKMRIVINPKIISIFQNDQYTQIDFHLCNQLKSPLAKWLFRFYSTHANPFPYEVETIYSLCGSEAKSLKDFKNDTLAKALNEVSEVSKKFGKRFEYKIIDMKLHVAKSCSTSQKRFLKK